MAKPIGDILSYTFNGAVFGCPLTIMKLSDRQTV